MDIRPVATALVGFALLAVACGDDTGSETQRSGEVTITWVHPAEGPYQGPVTLEGEAVDAGSVCAEADGSEIDFIELDSDDDSLTLRLDANITCGDGSGDFVLRDDATRAVMDGVPVEENVAGPWTIVSGTGAYSNLSGTGEATTELESGQVTKTYTGNLDQS